MKEKSRALPSRGNHQIRGRSCKEKRKVVTWFATHIDWGFFWPLEGLLQSATQQIPALLALSELLQQSELNLKLAYVGRCSFSNCRESLWKDGEGRQMDTCGASIACLRLSGSWKRRGHFTVETHSDFHKRQPQMTKHHPGAE